MCKFIIPIVSVFISGLFGLLVAVITWKLANQREDRKFRRENHLNTIKEKEKLYAEVIATIDKTIKLIYGGKDIDTVLNDLSINAARINLSSTERIIEKLNAVNEKIEAWTFEYRKSLPKRIGDTGLGMVSSEDIKHKTAADKIYSEVVIVIQELVHEIKSELKNLRAVPLHK